MYSPTLKTLTTIDVAKIGLYHDSYHGYDRYHMSLRDFDDRWELQQAAQRIIDGEPKFFDEELVKKFYTPIVKEYFTKAGKLVSWVRYSIN